jgi:hypothetical protein
LVLVDAISLSRTLPDNTPEFDDVDTMSTCCPVMVGLLLWLGVPNPAAAIRTGSVVWRKRHFLRLHLPSTKCRHGVTRSVADSWLLPKLCCDDVEFIIFCSCDGDMWLLDDISIGCEDVEWYMPACPDSEPIMPDIAGGGIGAAASAVTSGSSDIGDATGAGPGIGAYCGAPVKPGIPGVGAGIEIGAETPYGIGGYPGAPGEYPGGASTGAPYCAGGIAADGGYAADGG